MLVAENYSTLKINITKTKEDITGDNTALTNQMELCASQEQTMLNASCESMGLTGEAYATIDARLKVRPVIIRAHYFAYAAIKIANDKNYALLDELPCSITPGVLDTTECDGEITELLLEIAYQESQRDALVALDDSDNNSCHQTSVAVDSPYHIGYSYTTNIEALRREIDRWEEIKQAAYDYDSASSTIYDEASEQISALLTKSSEAVEYCLENGRYVDADINALNNSTTDYRLVLAGEHLTPEELAALQAALAGDGIITPEEIYTGTGTINTPLYTGLSKLPKEQVPKQNVYAVAEAHNLMWAAKDCEAIEQFYEHSYAKIPGKEFSHPAPQASDNSIFYLLNDNNYHYEYYGLSEFFQRVNEGSLDIFSTLDPEDANYQMMLAGTNLMNTLASGNYLIYSTDGIDMKLGFGEDKSGDAVICRLDINPESAMDILGPEGISSDSLEGTDTLTINTVTGDLNYAARRLEDMLKGELTPGEFNLGGAVLYEGAAWLLGSIKYAGPAFDVIDILLSLSEDAQAAKEGEALRESPYADFAADGSAYRKPFNECSFGINIAYEQDAFGDPDAGANQFLDYSVSVYTSDEQRANLDALTSAYANSPGGNGEYSTDSFIGDMENNTYNSVVEGAASPAVSADFIDWCNEPADLVYRYDMPESGIKAGDNVLAKDLSNYQYVINKDLHPEYALK